MQRIIKLACYRKYLLALAIIALFIVPPLTKAVPDPWFIDPNGTAGALTKTTSREALVNRYGDQNVKDMEVDIGEGETTPGTVLFPDDAKRRIDIIWKDPNKKVEIHFLTLHGKSSLWKTVHDISLGMSLKELERINRKPFTVLGYGWDYEGTVWSWEAGALTDELKGRVTLRLNSNSDTIAVRKDLDQLLGDRSFPSSSPALQDLNPQIYELLFNFDPIPDRTPIARP